MLKDITLGQYFPGASPLHRMDPRTKLLILILYIITIFCCGSLAPFALCAAGRRATTRRAVRWMLLLGVSQEVAKKETRTFPPGPPLVRAQTTRRGTAALLMFARNGKDSTFVFAFESSKANR